MYSLAAANKDFTFELTNRRFNFGYTLITLIQRVAQRNGRGNQKPNYSFRRINHKDFVFESLDLVSVNKSQSMLTCAQVFKINKFRHKLAPLSKKTEIRSKNLRLYRKSIIKYKRREKKSHDFAYIFFFWFFFFLQLHFKRMETDDQVYKIIKHIKCIVFCCQTYIGRTF